MGPGKTPRGQSSRHVRHTPKNNVRTQSCDASCQLAHENHLWLNPPFNDNVSPQSSGQSCQLALQNQRTARAQAGGLRHIDQRTHLIQSTIRYTALLIAAILLVAVQTPSAIPSLQKTSSDTQKTSSDTQKTSSDAAHLSAQLHSSDEQERLAAVEGLSELASADAVAALIGATTDRSERVRALAITKLGLIGDSRAVAALTSTLGTDKKPFVRKAAAYALARFHTNEVTSALSRALSDKDLEVRGAAAVTLADNPDAASIPALITALSDKSEFVRGQAGRALGMNGKTASGSVQKLIALLAGDADHEVKRQAAIALGQIGDSAAIPTLKGFIHSEDPYLAQSALDAIRMIEEVATGPSR